MCLTDACTLCGTNAPRRLPSAAGLVSGPVWVPSALTVAALLLATGRGERTAVAVDAREACVDDELDRDREDELEDTRGEADADDVDEEEEENTRMRVRARALVSSPIPPPSTTTTRTCKQPRAQTPIHQEDGRAATSTYRLLVRAGVAAR